MISLFPYDRISLATLGSALLAALASWSSVGPNVAPLRGAAPDDFVTAGGWINGTPSGARGNFGLKAGVDSTGAFIGSLNFVDHDEQLHVKSESITSYTVVDATTRTFTGTARIDGVAGTFTVTVSDAGEPGTADTFEITLSTGYTASGTLQGGNVQLHAP